MEFYKIKIAALDRSVEGSTVITFGIPAELQDAFKFTQGQFLTLETIIDNEQVRRSYSLCSSPVDTEWKVGIRKIPSGKFSTYAQETLKVGDTIQVAPPDGKFFIPIDENKSRVIAAYAAGSGITPILSIIKTHLVKESGTTVKLFYINKSSKTIMFKEELEALKNRFMDRLEISYFLTKEKRQIEFFNGRIDEAKLDQIFNIHGNPNNIQEHFICGPEQMIFLIKDYLSNKDVSTERIHFELFNSGLVPQERLDELAQTYQGKTTELTVVEGGKAMTLNVAQGSGNILDYALDNAADLPYACKGGVCCTCRAKLLEGEVEMLKTFGLEQDEIDDNYILTCQAIPLTDKVVVDFDQ